MDTQRAEQFQKAIERTNIISKTDPQGIITFVNEEFCRISGYSKEELLGKNHNIVRHPDVPKEEFAKLWETITRGEIYKATVKNLSKEGRTFYVNTTIIPITNEKEEIVEYVAIRYDVTREIEYKEELLKKEQELKELNATLEAKVAQKTLQLHKLNLTLKERVAQEVEKNSQKERIMFWQSRLASLGEMLSNIAHQWRQPLSELGLVIYNMKEAALQGSEIEVESEYKHAREVIRSMSQTIEDFASFFSPTRKKELFCAWEATHEALSIMRSQLHKEMVEVHVSGERRKLLGVSNEFTQVVLNLLKNSLDAFVTNSVLLREIGIEFSVTDDGMLQMMFRDNAGGIGHKEIYKIFEPYFTTKHKSRGTGLGLFIVKMICEKGFEGSIDVQSAQGSTTFTVRIPLP